MKKKRIPLTALGAVMFLAAAFTGFGQEPKPEEILERHVAAVGGRAKLDEIRNRIAAGTSEFESKLPKKKTTGKVLIASDKNNLMLMASFASKEYPMERIGYFGNEVSLPWVSAGTRSPLGSYLADHGKVLSEGIFGGAISSNSFLIDPSRTNGRLTGAGTKTVDGRKAYVLNYVA